MSNVNGKTYAMNVLTPVWRRWTWINRLVFMYGRAIPSTLVGLLGLSFIHFARWVIIKRSQWPDFGQPKEKLHHDYMLFISNFNGTWDQYIDSFSDGIPQGLDLFWYASVQYPHSIPITDFKNYIRHNQLYTDYYYNATPSVAQKDIKSALKVYDVIEKLRKAHAEQSHDDFKKTYIKALLSIQNNLPSQGKAPIASNDTENAKINSDIFVKNAIEKFS